MEQRSGVGARDLFTIDDRAPSREVACISRAALSVLRPEFAYFGIDAVSDAPWPEAARLGAELLDERRRVTRRRLPDVVRLKPSITAKLDLKVSEDFAAAMATVPFTIGCTGLNAHGQVIYSLDDAGASAAFALTSVQVRALRDEIKSSGGDPDLLIPMPSED